MYNFKKVELDGSIRIRQITDKLVENSAFPDPYLYFQSNVFLWVSHKNDTDGVIDWEWVKTEEELK